MPTATQALQTREAAAATAWAVYQRNVRGLSLLAICTLAAAAPIRRDDGSYDYKGGLGRALAKSTLHRWLSEAREQFRQDYIKRPVLDMIMEEDDRLEHLAATSMQALRSAELNSPAWFAAYDRHLRTLESRRKLLGIDRPQQIEVQHTDAGPADAATSKLNAAMAAAKAKRDEMLAAASHETDEA